MTEPITATKSERRSGASVGRVATPLACLAAALGWTLVEVRSTNELAAGSHSLLGQDWDTDGLADATEIVLGTWPDVVDTDGDTINDLEEVARCSDPRDPFSVPQAVDLDVGMYAYTENGFLALHTAIYADDGDLSSLSFELGVVVNGVRFVVGQQTYLTGTLSFLYTETKDPKDKILVLEMPIPERIIEQLGHLSVYTIVRDDSGRRAPVVDVLNVIHQAGTTMEVIPAPPSIAAQTGGGIVYRPLAGDGQAPPSSVSGQICWQDIVPVGVKGNAIQYEVEQASCQDFDSSCNESECAAKVGQVVEFPDPGKLLGG